jgi:hypothetical protein
MIAYNWQGHVIKVELRAFARFLWLAGGFVVTVDGRTFFPVAGEGFSFNTRTEFQVEENGEFYPGVVQSVGPLSRKPGMQYTVWIAGKEIANDRQMLKGRYLTLIIFYLLVFLVVSALTRAVLFFVNFAFR